MIRLAEPVSERDHVLGPAGARVTLVEYGDFECPYCATAYPIITHVRDAFGPNLRFVFRHFPLRASHPHAGLAAEAAEAAGAQGKFWEMHDRLYERQDGLDGRALRKHARKLGLDLERFDDELATEVHRERIRQDIASGARSGVNGTPTFYVNGVRYDGGWEDRAVFISAMVQAATGRHVEG